MKGDLHVHSDHSGDGHQSVEDIVRLCKERGMGVVTITDHNTLEGCKTAKVDGLIFLQGLEVTSAGGHILAYLVSEPVPRDRSVEETIDLIHGQGGIAVAPHPYRWWSGLKEGNVRGKRFDALETLNGRSLRGSNERAARLAQEMGVGVIGGSDAHVIDHLGRAYTEFPDDCQSPEDLVKAIKDRRTTVGGNSRSVTESFSYGTRSIGRWTRRGFKRL